MKKLNIIIPIYNVENYLKDCLDSIQRQSYTNFRAILINDGSTDKSKEIAESYLKDERFVLINQENMGVAYARNAGLEMIKSIMFNQNIGGGGNDLVDSNVVSNEDSGIESSYVGFVDSDDVIAKDYFRNLIYTLEINKVQISKSSDIEIYDTNNYNSKAFYLEQKKTKGKIHIIKKNNITKLEVWRCVFDYNLIKNLKFHKLLAEDIVFNFCAHALARKIAINKNARYFYRQRNGSIMKAGSNGNTKGSTMESFREIFYFLRDNNLLQTFDLPTAFIRPKLEYTSKKDEDFLEMKKILKDLNIPKYIVQNNKILNAAFSANSAKEFIAKTSSLKEKFKQYFQFRISKKQNIVKFFGKVIYSNKRL